MALGSWMVYADWAQGIKHLPFITSLEARREKKCDGCAGHCRATIDQTLEMAWNSAAPAEQSRAEQTPFTESHSKATIPGPQQQYSHGFRRLHA